MFRFAQHDTRRLFRIATQSVEGEGIGQFSILHFQLSIIFPLIIAIAVRLVGHDRLQTFARQFGLELLANH